MGIFDDWFGMNPAPPPTQTTTVQMSPEQRQLYDMAMPGINQWASRPLQMFPGTGVAGFDPAQVQGQNMALGAAGPQAGLAANAANATNFFTSGNIWDPSANPALGGAIDAATRPIMERFQEVQLPAIRGEAVGTGNFGSSRQGVAEGIASREASRAVGDVASRLVQDQYGTNVRAQLAALGLLPTVQQGQLAPAITTSGVGDVRQALAQARLGEDVNRFNFDQMAPLLQSRELLSILQGIPGGTTTAVGSVPQEPSDFQRLLGIGAMGASLIPRAGPGVASGMRMFQGQQPQMAFNPNQLSGLY